MNYKAYAVRVLCFGLVCSAFFGTLYFKDSGLGWLIYPRHFVLFASVYVLIDWFNGKFKPPDKPNE
jgi:hypothetical protein